MSGAPGGGDDRAHAGGDDAGAGGRDTPPGGPGPPGGDDAPPGGPDRRLQRDVAWNLIPVALLGVVGLGLSFVIARRWGAAAYATFNLVSLIYFAFGVVGAGGLQFAVLRAIAEEPTDRDRVARVVVGALVPGVGLAALAAAAFVIARPAFARWLHGADIAEGMTWAAPGLACFVLNKLLFGVVNGLRRMRALAIYTSLRYLLIAAGLGVAHLADLPAARVAAIWTITEAPLLVVLVVELLATVPVRRARGFAAWCRPHLSYGARGVGATLAQELNSKLDVWMLGLLTTDKPALGVYALAAALHEGLTQLAGVLQANLDPLLARALARGDRAGLADRVARTRRWFVPSLVGLCALAAALYPWTIPWLIGDPAFAAGAAPFAILLAGQALASPWSPFAHLLLMAKRPGWHTALLAIAISTSLAGDLALIPRWGALGAAVATALSTVVAALALRTLARRVAAVAL